jgi:zinc protease
MNGDPGSAAVAQAGPLVLVEPSRDLPLVAVSIALRTGASEDPEGREGASRLLTRWMRRTAGGLPAQVVDTRIDSLGAAFGADVSHSAIVFHGTVIARSLDPFVDLLIDILARPGFDPKEFGLLQRETEASLIEALDDDRGLVRRWFRRKLFEGHPYSRSSSGTLKTIAALEHESLRALYERVLVPDNLVFAFSGDITQARAYEIAGRITAALPNRPAPLDATSDPSVASGRRLVFVDKPERTQTQILIGGLGTHPRDDDHFALHVANTVFGGTFTARMTQEIRAKRGWSYGAYSSLPHDRRRQAFSMWTFPKASDAAACIELELELLRLWREQGISKRELNWAKRFLVRSHAFARDTAAKRVGLLLDAALYDLPDGYYARHVEQLSAVTLDQANQAVQRRISDQDLLIAVVGTHAEIGAAVEKAISGLSRVEVVRFDAPDA